MAEYKPLMAETVIERVEECIFNLQDVNYDKLNFTYPLFMSISILRELKDTYDLLSYRSHDSVVKLYDGVSNIITVIRNPESIPDNI